jgi:hypothetical protein
MLYITTIGFGLGLANSLVAISYIRDLNELTILEVKFHRNNGRLAAGAFYFMAILCITFGVIPLLNPEALSEFLIPTIFWHTFLGGIVATILFTTKIMVAKFNKDMIYKFGKFIGPIAGFGGYLLAYLTANIDFYFYVNPQVGIPNPVVMPNYLISLMISIFIGVLLFAIVKLLKYRTYGKLENKQSLHGVAMILHGISFGYEASAKELVGTPVLYKYVFPKTYEFLERYSEKIGLDLEELKSYNLNEAMRIAMDKFEEIGMAEQLKIDWLSENEFTIESVNCSTAVVRSYMDSKELKNSICPWGILAATIVSALTEKDIEIGASDFNEIGAISKLKIVEKESN